MAVDTTILGLSPEEAEAKPYIASMGIYVFKKSALVKFLESDYPRITISAVRSFPNASADGAKVQAYLFNDYWEDIGTMKSFFEANLNLARIANWEFYNWRLRYRRRDFYPRPSWSGVTSRIPSSPTALISPIARCTSPSSVCARA